MDLRRQSCTKAVSPLTIAVDDEGLNDLGSDVVANPCSSTATGSCLTTTATTTVESVKKPRTKWRKAEDKPHHPRTGYNFFFQLERERMLLGIDHLPIAPHDVINLPVGGSRLNEIKSLSYQRDGFDQSIRPRVLVGEKLGFADLARNVASKWKKLDSNIKKLFEEKAEKERMRYKRELEAWNEEQKNKAKVLEESRSQSLVASASTVADMNKFSHLSPVTMSLKDSYYSMTPNKGFGSPSLQASSDDRQRTIRTPNNYVHVNCRPDHEYCEDQMTLKNLLSDSGVVINGGTWHDSPRCLSIDALEEKLLRKLAQSKVVSPSESSVRATSLNFPHEDIHGRKSPHGITSSMSELSLKINQFIEEVCCVSEDLHDLSKRGTVDQNLPQLPLREIERQVDFCISDIRRLSSQVHDFQRLKRDELIEEHYNLHRNQVLQASQTSNETLRTQRQHEFDIPSLMKEVNKVRHTLDCSDRQIDELLESRKRLLGYESAAAVIMNDNRKKFRIDSDNSMIVQPSPRRVSNMNETNRQCHTVIDNSCCGSDNSSAFETVDGYYHPVSNSVMSSNEHTAQGVYVNSFNQNNALSSTAFRNQEVKRNQGKLEMLLKRNSEERQADFLSTYENLGKASHSEITQRRLRNFIQTDKNVSYDGRSFSDEAAIDVTLDFCDDDTACDIGNMECDAAFDMESMFAAYPAV